MTYRPQGHPKTQDQHWLGDEFRAVENAISRLKYGPAVITLTDAATIAVNANRGADDFRVVLGGNRTLANPTGLRSGQRILFRILQDGSGGHTLAYGSMYKFEGATAPVVDATADALSILEFQYDAADDTLAVVSVKLDVR